MCKPDYFDVFYEINAWMNTEDVVDVSLAQSQWEYLAKTYQEQGFDIQLIDPEEGLPDMVFTANGALVLGDKVALPRFKFPQRQPETKQFNAWFREYMPKAHVFIPDNDFEGEGDAMFAGGVLYAGYGFRSDKDSHKELSDFFDVEVRSLQLVDDRFYHLDTAMSILDGNTIAYFPSAFSDESQEVIEQSFDRIIHANETDAEAFGLNMVSDGKDAFVSAQAVGLQKEIHRLGFNVHSVDVSEFKKAGGGTKCMTLLLNQLHM